MSSWLCTEARPFLNISENSAMLTLRGFAMMKDRKSTIFYIKECNELVKRMKEHGADWKANARFVRRVAKLVKKGELEKAYAHYVEGVKKLIRQYWPECEFEGVK